MASFSAIVPPDMSAAWSAAIEQALMDAIDTTLTAVNSDFGKTVATWKQQPDFTVEPAHYEGADLVGTVSTDNEIYGYVNSGTQPHDIFPVKAKKLHFMSGYTAKTSVRVIGSHAGGPSGTDVFSAGVHHPGSAGREFDEEIASRRQRNLENNVTAAILRATQAGS